MHARSVLRKAVAGSRFERSFHVSCALNQKLQKLDGRVAIAAGCTDGIGFQMAKRLAQEGAHVVVSSRRKKNVDRAVEELKAEELKASGFECHIGSSEDRTGLLQSAALDHGGFDILLNNAGVNPHVGNILDTSDGAFDKTFDVNVKANFCLVRDAVPYMKNRKTQSSIVLTSSMSGYQPNKLPGAYAVSKSAIFGLIKAFMPDLLQHNIRINCIALGIFDTPFADVITKNKDVTDKFFRIVPMKRFGQPHESAGLAYFLCSDESSYITGETFCIGGGAFTRL